MSFAAFATGFLNTSSALMDRRTQRADNYFEQQMERAQRHGMNNLAQRRQRRDQISGLAENLRSNAQMPEEIVRALINEGPEALSNAMRIYEQSASSGVNLSEEFWNQAYPTAAQMAIDTDQPLSEFLDQVSGLYPQNLEATQETGGDPFSAFMSSALGMNAMDRARQRLRDTQIGMGYSADDLLSMEARPQHERVYQGPSVGPNLQNIAAARAAVSGREPLTASQRADVSRRFREEVAGEVESIRGSSIWRNREDLSDAERSEIEEQARAQVAVNIAEDFAFNPTILRAIPAVWNALPDEVKEAMEGATSEEGSEGQTERAFRRSEAEDSEISEDYPQEIVDANGTRLTRVEVRRDGRAIYRTETGQLTPPLSASGLRRMRTPQSTPAPAPVVQDIRAPSPDGLLEMQGEGRSTIPVSSIPSVRAEQERNVELPPGRASEQRQLTPSVSNEPDPNITYEEWQQMSRQERRDANLPVSHLGGQMHFRRLMSGGLGLPDMSSLPFGTGRGEEPEPAMQVTYQGRNLVLSDRDEETHSWIYIDQESGEEVLIPIGAMIQPN